MQDILVFLIVAAAAGWWARRLWRNVRGHDHTCNGCEGCHGGADCPHRQHKPRGE